MRMRRSRLSGTPNLLRATLPQPELSQPKLSQLGRLTAVMLSGAMLCGLPGAMLPAVFEGAALAQGALRPAIGKPLQKAEALAKKKQYAAALAQVRVAAAVKDKTPSETVVIDKLRAAIAQESGDYNGAITADETLLRSGMVGPGEQQTLLLAIASATYQLKDYAATINAVQRYFKAGGTSPQMQQLLIQCYYLQRDYGRAAAAQSAQIDAELRARQIPPEAQFQLLANCELQTNDQAGLTRTMTHLVTYYPKPDYWAQLLHGLRSNPNVPDRLQFDIDRIRLEVGLLTNTPDFMDMAELAVQAGLPSEGLAVMDKGYATGALGRDPQAPREARLKALIQTTVTAKKASIAADETTARSATDGNALLGVGYSYVDLGQAEKGIAVMKEGIAKGGVLAPDDATLHLGLAYLSAGDKANAVATLRTVGGADGAAELANLWVVRIGKV